MVKSTDAPFPLAVLLSIIECMTLPQLYNMCGWLFHAKKPRDQDKSQM